MKQKDYDESIKNSKFIEASSLLVGIEEIKAQINEVKEKINKITQEYNEIQQENMKLYYIEPSSYEKFNAAKEAFVNKIETQYWNGKTFDDARKVFPLIGAETELKNDLTGKTGVGAIGTTNMGNSGTYQGSYNDGTGRKIELT